MSRKLLTFVLEQRLVIVALVGLLIGGGIWAAIHLPIDAVPDVTNVQVLKPLPFGLDQAAVDAVRRWKFRPGTLNGQPVDVIFNLTVNFKLN